MRVVYTSKDIREKDPDGKEMSLQDYNICDEANLFIVHRLRGGSETDTSPETSLYEKEEEEQTDVFDMTILDDVGDESVEDLSPPRGGSETDTSPESSLYEEDEEEEQIDVFDMTILDDFGDESVEDLSPPPKMYNGEVELTKEPICSPLTTPRTDSGQRCRVDMQ
ncbi:hypothetical protein DPMN_118632 [Dreissena polymorpha]|uniref:Ubiquitin-like domain-containing protein n=2 Tax=Dreissena polymorpha TaxID=45954 RepID=A0A9D4GHQ3_DREPO|nr:hypothetical protein DPMN_118632 [Dreissena polymorpha]